MKINSVRSLVGLMFVGLAGTFAFGQTRTITPRVGRAVSGNPVQTFKIKIAYGSSIMASTDRFEFSAGPGRAVTLGGGSTVATFEPGFRSGEAYTVTQTSGPRACNMDGQQTGTIGNQDVQITVNCGFPPLTLMKLDLRGVGQGETFKFADNFGRTFSAPFSTVANLGGFPTGDRYSITQTAGPRACRITGNTGTVPAQQSTIVADCSASAGSTTNAPPGNSTTTPPSTARWTTPDLVSRSSDDKSFGTFYDATAPVVGGKGEDEGRYVAFVSSAAGLGGSKGKHRQILWRDRKTGETKLISSSAASGEGNQDSFAPAISADGKSVAFESYATNLVPIDTNNVRDVFVWNHDANTVTAVSDAPGGIEANAEAFEPTISGDGRLIAFTSSASTLTRDVDGTSQVNVFLKDMQSGSVTLISRDEKTKKGGGGSRPSISEDGTRIAFHNYFPLISSDKNGLWDIYLWDRGNPKLKVISKTGVGGDREQGDESASRVVAPSISGDGRYVAFSTTAGNVVPGDGNKKQDVFIVEVDSGRIARVSTAAGNADGDGDSPVGQGERIAISFDGGLVAFSTKATNLGGNIVVRNVGAGESFGVSKDLRSGVGQPVMSRTGRWVVFGTASRLDTRFQSSGIFAVGIR